MNNKSKNKEKIIYLKERLKDYKDLLILNETIGIDSQYSEILEYMYYFEELYPDLKPKNEDFLISYGFGCQIVTYFFEPFKMILENLGKTRYIENKDDISLLGEIYEYILHFELLISPEVVGKDFHEKSVKKLNDFYIQLLEHIINNTKKDANLLNELNSFTTKTFRKINYDLTTFSLLFFNEFNQLVEETYKNINED